MILHSMDHGNKVGIPTERIEDLLREGAVPGFWGTIRIQVRPNPAAALEIDLVTEKTSHSDGGKQREETTVIPSSNDRWNRVRMKIAELREKFILVCPVTRIEAVYQDGKIVRFSVTEGLEPAEPRMRFAPAAQGG